MKQMNLFLLITLSALISCSKNKNTTATKPAPVETQKPGPSESAPPVSSEIPMHDSVIISENKNTEVLMPVIISFFSIGEGIDRGQKEKLMTFITSYEKKAGKKMEYSEVHWGREGETDFCFPMTGFSDIQVTDFLKGAKEALNTAQHVHFVQNQACRKGR